MNTCNVCSSDTTPFGEARILAKYDIRYFRCPGCGYIQTEEPYWLEEAYSETISTSDLGLVERNLAFARICKSLIGAFFGLSGRFLDFGGGYGLFVRLMRDRGLDFYRYDRHCVNLFARGFDAPHNGANVRYELVTAFEVFEHLVHPNSEIAQMLDYSDNILFSTILLPRQPPPPGEWWYYATESGQHVSLYTAESLRFLAAEHGCHLVSDGRLLHLLSKRRVSPQLFKLVTRDRVARFLGAVFRRESLLAKDYRQVTGRDLI